MFDTHALVLKMLKNSQTKVIFPIITYGLIKSFLEEQKDTFLDSDVRRTYQKAVLEIQEFLGHRLHTGGKYYDAYPIRNLPRYGVLSVTGKSFILSDEFKEAAYELANWIPLAIKEHIDSKIGAIPALQDDSKRLVLAKSTKDFQLFIQENISANPSNFEIFTFAIIKIHLERFACKIYRDTRTSAHDKGVDLSTNFGVVYQIKKLKLQTIKGAQEVYSEIKTNFDSERMQDGKVVLIIDDISSEVKTFLINMKVQAISRDEVIQLCSQFFEVEDRMKVLRVIYDEFRREYESQI